MQYIWQQKDWTNFRYELDPVQDLLLAYLEKTAHLSGILKALPEAMREEAVVDLMTAEALKTSAIEGEFIKRDDVKSSIRNHLGLNAVPEAVHDLRAIGIGEMMTEVRKSFAREMDAETLFNWHALLLSYRKDLTAIGRWRQHAEPMQIISGAMGKEKVHFEAPPSASVPGLMAAFYQWFNQSSPGGEEAIRFAPVRAGIAHLYFETIHPFEDGNGRIGRAIAEKVLAQGLGAPVPFSLSRAIEWDKKSYYQSLEQAQRSGNLTAWLQYFVPMVLRAVSDAEQEVAFILKKAKFFDRYLSALQERHLKAVRRMFDAGPGGFEGGMNARKYAGLTGVSKATATRDLQYLQESGVFQVTGSGRSTRYLLNLPEK